MIQNRNFPGQAADQPKSRKRKKTEFQKTVDKLDRWFSEYIRLLEMDPVKQKCQCVTCGRFIPWKGHGTHCGHFIEKSYTKNLRVRYKRKNAGVQCYTCNVTRSGHRYEFFKYIENTWGQGTAQELETHATRSFNEKIFNFPKKIKRYKILVKELKAMKLDGQLNLE